MTSTANGPPGREPTQDPTDRTAARSKLRQEIAALEARLADLQARMPAHSIPPAMMIELDELEGRLAEARARLEILDRAFSARQG